MKSTKLQKLDVYQLHNAEFGQFITRLIDDFSKSELKIDADADFKTLFEELKSQLPLYDKALEQIRENENTKKIAELDTERDQDFQALRDSIKPYRNTKKDEQKQAYNALKIVFDEYKDISILSYEEQTKKTSALISVLKSDNYKPYVSALKIEDFLQDLQHSNTAFDELFAERSVKNIGKESYDTKALRKQITEIYRKFSTYTETLSQIKKDEFYKKALEVINNSRKYYADTIAKRGTTKTKKENQ